MPPAGPATYTFVIHSSSTPLKPPWAPAVFLGQPAIPANFPYRFDRPPGELSPVELTIRQGLDRIAGAEPGRAENGCNIGCPPMSPGGPRRQFWDQR